MRTAVSDAMLAESQIAAPRCTHKKTCNNLDLLPHATESELVHVVRHMQPELSDAYAIRLQIPLVK